MTKISSLSTHSISSANSTSSLLGASATYTGTWEDVTRFSTVAVSILGSLATDGTLYFDLSTDNGVTFISVESSVSDATATVPRIITATQSHVRIRYVNGLTPQTGTFSIQTKYANGQPLGLFSSVDGTITGETPVQNQKAVIAGNILDDNLQSTTAFGNVSLLANKALKVATPPSVLFQAKRPTDPVIPSGTAVTIDPVLNVEANVVDSGWVPVTSFGGGSLINVISDVSIDVYILNASDTSGNNIQGSSNPTLTTVPSLSATIGAAFFDDFFRIVVVNTSGTSANSYSIRAEGGQTPAAPVFTSLNQQTFKFFPAPLARIVNSPEQDRNFGYIGDQTSVRFEGINGTVASGAFEKIARGAVVFPSTLETFRIAAGGNAADTAAGAGARSVEITFLDENWNEVTETLATAGASASAATSVTGYRVQNVEVKDSGTYGGANTGAISIENSSTGDLVAVMAAGEGKAEQAVYTVPANKTLYVEVINPSVGQSDSADLRLVAVCNADNFTAPTCGAKVEWRIQDFSGAVSFVRKTFLKFDEKTDIFLEAIRVTGSGTASVAVDIEGSLIDN